MDWDEESTTVTLENAQWVVIYDLLTDANRYCDRGVEKKLGWQALDVRDRLTFAVPVVADLRCPATFPTANT